MQKEFTDAAFRFFNLCNKYSTHPEIIQVLHTIKVRHTGNLCHKKHINAHISYKKTQNT